MIEFGTSTHAIAGFGEPGKPFRQAVAEIADCGYQHMMLLGSEQGPAVGASGDAPQALVHIGRSDLAAIQQTIARHGLRIGCLYPGCAIDFCDAGKDATAERLLSYRNMAWRMGCHIMVHAAGSAPAPRTPLQDKESMLRNVAEVMDRVSSDAPGSVFKMAVDVHYGGIVETVADCGCLLDMTTQRNAGLCLNTGHMTTLDEPGWTLITERPDRVHVLAWKDHLTGPDLPKPVYSVELGTGRTPFERYVEALRAVECDALNLITFEDVALPEKRDALRRSREYALGLLRRGD